MSEEQERDQLGLWEKLNRLYGDKDRPAGGEGFRWNGDIAEAGREAELEVEPPEAEGVASGLPQAGETFRDPRQNSQRGLQMAAGNGPARINEVCSRCRRNCKQTGRKINRMLCIGFLPMED